MSYQDDFLVWDMKSITYIVYILIKVLFFPICDMSSKMKRLNAALDLFLEICVDIQIK